MVELRRFHTQRIWMQRGSLRRYDVVLTLLFLLNLASCAGFPRVQPSVVPVARSESQTSILLGTLTYTGDLIDTNSDNSVLLLDLAGFVQRDHHFHPSRESQILGPLKLDPDAPRGNYSLRLPAAPGGTFVDLDHNGKSDHGVQIFNLIWWSNSVGDPFASGDDQINGWGGTYASTTHDPNSDGEISGGKIVVWAPDVAQFFPTDFGTDGRLFTSDDPVGPLPAG
jgi:hypothetical protein